MLISTAASQLQSPIQIDYLPSFEVSLFRDHQPVTPIENLKKINLHDLTEIRQFLELTRPETFHPHPLWMIPEEFRPKKRKYTEDQPEERCKLVLSTGEEIKNVYTIENPIQAKNESSFFDTVKLFFTPSPKPPLESFHDWKYIAKEFDNPEYQRNPEEYIQLKYMKECEWRRLNRACLLLNNTSKRLKTILEHNVRCDLIATIYKRIREGAGVEVASNQIKRALEQSDSDMTKEHLVAIIGHLLAYYGLELGSKNLKFPFQVGKWFQDILTSSDNQNFGEFGYALCQTTVHDLETEIRTDLSSIQRLFEVTIPPRVIPSRNYELTLRLEGMQEITALFDEIHLIQLLFLFYFPHAI